MCMYVSVFMCASACCTYFIYVTIRIYVFVCKYVCLGGLGEIELSLQFRAGFPTEDLETEFIRAPKGCQVHRDSLTLIKPKKDSLMI